MDESEVERIVKNELWKAGGCEEVRRMDEAIAARKHMTIEERLAESKQSFDELEQRLKQAIRDAK